MTADDRVQIRLLGGFSVDGAPGADLLRSPRLQSLLGYLIVHRASPAARSALAFRMWPDSSEAQARTNLRQALHHLRRALPHAERLLQITKRDVQWRASGPAWVDLVGFEEAAAQALTGDTSDARRLAEAVARCTGDLLPDCYDDWAVEARARVRAQLVQVLERAAAQAEAVGDQGAAGAHLEALLRLEPLREDAHRALVRVHAAAGDRARAIQAYDRCRIVLRRELGTDPSPQTIEACETVLGLRARVVRPDGGPRPAMVGRHLEWAQLRAVVEQAAAGRASFCLIRGEPGAGKTRLAEELLARCELDGWATAAGPAYEAEGALPFAPIAEVLRSPALAGSLSHLPAGQRTEIARLVPALGDEQAAGAPAAPNDLGRAAFFDALAEAIVGVGRPTALLLDDLQWCDADTLQFLHFLLRYASRTALLVVGVCRDHGAVHAAEIDALLGGLRRGEALTEVELSPLAPDDAAALAAALTGLPGKHATVQRLVRTSGGNPFFLVELARQVRGQAGSTRALPTRAQAAVEARLEALSPLARKLAELLAVVGSPVPWDLTEDLVPDVSPAELAEGLDELWARKLVREHPAGHLELVHDIVREVIVDRLGPARRRRLHTSVAGAFARRSTALDGDHLRVAAHYERAGRAREALGRYLQAVDAVMQVHAYDEAIALARRGLGLLPAVPRDVERDEVELGLLVRLGAAIYAGPGIALDDAPLYGRAEALRLATGRPLDPSTTRIMANLANSSRDFRTTRRMGLRLLRRARDTGDEVVTTEAHYALGVAACWLGRQPASRRHFDSALATYRSERADRHIALGGQDPGAVCLVRLAFASFQLGRAADATALAEGAQAHARAIGHGYSTAYVRAIGGWLALDQGALDRAEDLVAGLVELCPTNRWVAHMFDILSGWIACGRGDVVAACERLDAAVETGARPGMGLMEPLALLCSARATAIAGRSELALAAARRARAIAAREMPFHHAEALIVEADALRRAGADGAEILATLQQAADVARRQGSLVQELRALDRLARGGGLARGPTGQRWAATLEARAAPLSGEERAVLLAGPVGGA